ncbi:tripartite tricarboxylate transporter substrate binding protein [uncultured Azohydromonas sp.]|uniref:Bug family tripartite tricarboxylate transporter substrate binding protein n=1 Tax=uncultured Azohydromonas sp. TaxID=487342 RepID=UPI0026050D50|nr:tripartite tricarboxylate transporter substrate-binding protein [uncultured Azohydromonas sp.]
MIPRRRLVAAATLLPLAGAVRAQGNFPSKPITLVVPFAPGGVADLTARAVAEPMARSLGQSIVVDNRPSAGSIVASQAVARAAPDGHTLLLMSNSNALSVSLFKKLPYDTLRDFAPVGLLGVFDIGLFVPAGSRFSRLQDLIAYAKANPGKLTIATISAGSTQHLAAEMFKREAGIDALVVPYKGTPAVVSALRGGEADVAFEILAPVLGQVGGGVLRALAVSSDKRNPALPQVPTVQESGVLRYAVASWNALAVPAATPAAVIARLNQAAREAVATPAVQQRLGVLGVRLASGTPAQLGDLLKSEIAHWGTVIRAAGIQPE